MEKIKDKGILGISHIFFCNKKNEKEKSRSDSNPIHK